MSETIAYRGETATDAESKTLDELKLELDSARTNWAAMSAKRQNRLFDRRIEGYNQTKQTYSDLVAEYGRQSLAEPLAQAENAQERNLIALSYIIDMQNQLRAETDKISDSKRMRKFGRAIGKWFATGSKTTRFVKSAAVSMTAGVIGGLTGVVGGAVAMGAALRFTKGYLMHEVSGLGAIETDAYHEAFLDDEDGETLLARAQAKSTETFEAAGGDQQAKRRAAVRRGLGVMTVGFVVGGTVGSLLHSAIDIPTAHATPLVHETYSNPGPAVYESGDYTNPGISSASAEYSTPGLHDSAYQNPGLTEAPTAVDTMSPGLSGSEVSYTSPGLETVTSSHPGLTPAEVGTVDYTSPGLTSGEYSSPGLADHQDVAASAYASPGLVTHDVSSPGLVEVGGYNPSSVNADTYSSPGLHVVTDHQNPDLHVNASDDYQSPGLAITDTEHTHVLSDSAEQFDLDGPFTVQYGHGYVHEIMDAARVNDINLTSQQAWEIHKDIVNKVGTDYIDLLRHKGPDTYPMGDSKYETGISAPGKAEWDAQAADILQHKFTELSIHGNGEFTVSHISDGHDVDAQSYYDALKGVDKSHWETILNEAAPHLRSVTYDGESLTYHDASGWHFREVDALPPEARAAIKTVANKHNWSLAA